MAKSHPKSSFEEDVKLSSDDSAICAVTRIAQFLVLSMQRNEDGIIEDTDTECLHQYRVSIRKLRSLLALIKGVYPAEDSERLRTAFGGYTKDTNMLRDLDVYLLDEAAYRARLDSYLVDGLDSFFNDLQRERNLEFRRLRKLLVSKDYQARRKANQEWFFLPDLPKGPAAEESIYILATKQISRRYQSICRKGKRIGTGTPDSEIHKLRIECKKLRYLLELFSSLLPQKKARRIVRRLMGMQTKLGRFNDYCLQTRFLVNHLKNSSSLSSGTAAAIGGLVTSLSQSKQNSLENISERVSKFSDSKTRTLIKSLLKA